MYRVSVLVFDFKRLRSKRSSSYLKREPWCCSVGLCSWRQGRVWPQRISQAKSEPTDTLCLTPLLYSIALDSSPFKFQVSSSKFQVSSFIFILFSNINNDILLYIAIYTRSSMHSRIQRLDDFDKVNGTSKLSQGREKNFPISIVEGLNEANKGDVQVLPLFSTLLHPVWRRMKTQSVTLNDFSKCDNYPRISLLLVIEKVFNCVILFESLRRALPRYRTSPEHFMFGPTEIATIEKMFVLAWYFNGIGFRSHFRTSLAGWHKLLFLGIKKLLSP